MFEQLSRAGPVAVGAVVVLAALLVVSGTVRAWVAAVAGPLVSLAILAGAVLWLGGKV